MNSNRLALQIMSALTAVIGGHASVVITRQRSLYESTTVHLVLRRIMKR
jgi:hypothetical protein